MAHETIYVALSVNENTRIRASEVLWPTFIMYIQIHAGRIPEARHSTRAGLYTPDIRRAPKIDLIDS